MFLKREFICCIVLFLYLIFCPFLGKSISYQETIRIFQIPAGNEIPASTPINLTLEVLDISMVESVNLVYCSIKPKFVCHFPSIVLNKTIQGLFTGVFTPEYAVGTTMGYHFSLIYSNGSIEEIPNGFFFPNNQTNILQAEDSQYYFELFIVEKSNSNNYQTSSFEKIYVFITAILLIVMRVKKR